MSAARATRADTVGQCRPTLSADSVGPCGAGFIDKSKKISINQSINTFTDLNYLTFVNKLKGLHGRSVLSISADSVPC